MALEEKLTKEQKALVLKEVIPKVVLDEINLLRCEFLKGTAFETVPTERNFIRIIGLEYFLFKNFDCWKSGDFYEMIGRECKEYNLKTFLQCTDRIGIYRQAIIKDSQSSSKENLGQSIRNAVLYEPPDSYKIDYAGKKESEILGSWPPDNLEFFTLEELFPTNESTIEGNEKIGEVINFVVNYLDSNLIRNKNGRLLKVSEIVNDLKRLTKSRDYYSFLAKTIKFKEVLTIEELTECSSIKSNLGVIKRIGEGKGGVVYKVFSEELNQNLALKIIPQNKINPEEAKLMARIVRNDLENIVRIYDAGYYLASRMSAGMIRLRSIIGPTIDDSNACWNEEYAILMEYVDGQTLEEILKERKLTPHEVLDYSAQILNGIQSLRKHGITHRDLKTKNIKVNTQGEVKILDFGIATDEPHPEARNNHETGAPKNMEADDLISFGLLVYKMATGKNLIDVPGKELMGHDTYVDELDRIKQFLYQEGRLVEEYKKKIANIMPNSDNRERLSSIILYALEYRNFDKIQDEYPFPHRGNLMNAKELRCILNCLYLTNPFTIKNEYSNETPKGFG